MQAMVLHARFGSCPQLSASLTLRALSQASDMPWSTVGVNTNIISASMSALMDGLEYALVEFGSSCSIDAGMGAADD